MAKTVSAIPEGFRSITPYLVVKGVSKLLDFVKDAFDAQELVCAKEADGSIPHAGVRVGGSMLEMGDAGGSQHQPLTAGLHYYVRDVDSVYRRALAAGATSLYEPRLMPYGDRESTVQDCCGNYWYIATHQGSSYRPGLMQDLNPYLTLNDSARFLSFLEKAFNASVVQKNTGNAGKIAHATVSIGDTVLELSEAHGQWGPRPAALHYYTQNSDQVFAQALRAGAKELIPMADQPYGDHAGGVGDDWGNHWYIATHIEDLTLEEIQRRSTSASSKG